MDKMVQTMFDNIEKNTGKPVSYWVDVVNKSGLDKHGQKVNFLKTEHNFTHGFANLVVHEAKNDGTLGAPADDSETLLSNQFVGKENLKPVYDDLIKKVTGFGKDVEVAVKKNYVSLRRDVQFGIIQPSTKSRLDVGLVIKSDSGDLEKAGSFNTMCTHRIRLEEENTNLDESLKWLKKAYSEAKRS